jgi:hypothetical protein
MEQISNGTDFEWNRFRMEQISNETDLEFEQFSYLNRFSNFKIWKFEKETENFKRQQKQKHNSKKQF